jgi:hypothetical protein
MSKRTAKGTIQVTAYESIPYSPSTDGPNLNELRVTETFIGGIEGEGVARMLQAERKDGSASFVAIERVTGTIDGRSGSFLLQDQGTLEGTRVKGTWFVVAGSATGALAGLRGEGSFEAELGQHAHYVLDHWFE